MAEKFFCIGFLVAVGMALAIWMLVSLARSFKDDFDERIQRLWDASLRTSGTGSMLAGRLCDMNTRLEALEKAAQLKETKP